MLSPEGEADLQLDADLSDRCAAVPKDLPFGSMENALKFTGPLPFTLEIGQGRSFLSAVSPVF